MQDSSIVGFGICVDALYIDESILRKELKDDADFIIFNTCAIRENAELKVYGHLGALKNLKANCLSVFRLTSCFL